MASLVNELDCSVCLSIFTDPVTLVCGHNFCRSCINAVLDTQKEDGVYTCPECRADLGQRPSLQRNVTLNNIVEHFIRKSEKKAVFCTYCIASPVPAVKSCLMCEASLCDQHLAVHSKSPEHVLCGPISSYKDVRCSTHGQLFMFYCTEDAARLCVTCTLVGEHVGHKMELLSDFFKKQKEKLMVVYEELDAERSDVERRIRDLELPKERLQSKFAAAEDKVSAAFKVVHSQLGELKKRVLRDMKTQRKQMLNGLIEQIDELNLKKGHLRGKMDRITELCSMTDPTVAMEALELANYQKAEPKDGDDEKKHVEAAEGDLDESVFFIALQKGFSDILSNAKQKLRPAGEATITLDVDTAANNVAISLDCKSVSWLVNQSRPKKPGRFQYHQVLSAETFSSGRHYWEIESSDAGNWMVGVAYPSIEREGTQAIIGKNNKSWSLCRWNNQYYSLHEKKQTPLNVKFGCRRFRISLDYEAGTLTFYDLNHLTKPMFTFVTTFTEPLHAAISIWESAFVSIVSEE